MVTIRGVRQRDIDASRESDGVHIHFTYVAVLLVASAEGRPGARAPLRVMGDVVASAATAYQESTPVMRG